MLAKGGRKLERPTTSIINLKTFFANIYAKVPAPNIDRKLCYQYLERGSKTRVCWYKNLIKYNTKIFIQKKFKIIELGPVFDITEWRTKVACLNLFKIKSKLKFDNQK